MGFCTRVLLFCLLWSNRSSLAWSPVIGLTTEWGGGAYNNSHESIFTYTTAWMVLPFALLELFFSDSPYSFWPLISLPVSCCTFLCLVLSSCSPPPDFLQCLKLLSSTIGALNRMYSLLKDTFAFSTRNLQLSVRPGTAREDCWRRGPLNSLTCFKIQPLHKLRLCSTATPPRCSHTTLTGC